MINLSQTPEAVLTVKIDEHVLVKGVECIFTEYMVSEGTVIMTTVDSNIAEYNRLNDACCNLVYGHYVKHARIGRRAVNTRQEFLDALLTDIIHVS
jgi:hypothetical protein